MNYQVSQSSSYGQAFDHMPLKTQILQMKVMFLELRKKFGGLGTLRFIGKTIKTQNQLKKRYGKAIQTRFADIPPSAIKEFCMITAVYLVLEEIEDKERAYEFVKGIFHKIGPTCEFYHYRKEMLRRIE